MINDIYNKRILELAANVSHVGRLATPDASAIAHSKLCGSKVTIDICVDGDVVTDFGQDIKACALGQASAAIMAQNIIGSTTSELRALRDIARRILKDNGDPPDGKWADLAVLVPVRDYKARHASTLLVFDAVVDAVNQLEIQRAITSVPAE